ncbi:MAG: hypothetical protein OQJ97_03370 [Rhodospirillales bacterium]|nr:hypothetical protein [Rhodospirillales bacterium]
MNNANAAQNKEIVGLFPDRQSFEATVNSLLNSGFERDDLSVLSSHESIDAAGSPPKPWKDALTAMVGELKFEGPLIASGAIYLVGGPVSSVIAAVIGATVGGVAVKEVIEEVTSTPHTEDFARSVEAGSIILWVNVETAELQATAEEILQANGGQNIHLHESA